MKKYKNNLVNNFSNTENITLNWLRYIIVGLILIWVMIILGNDYLLFSAVVLYVIFIGYFGIKQVGIFTQTQAFDQNSNNNALTFNKNSGKQQNLKQRDNEDTEELIRVDIKDQELNLEQDFIKYQRSSLNEPVIKEIHHKLVFIMQSEKLYKNPTLTLSELARRLDVQSNHLSQIINSIEKKNFFDYINSLRIEEFKSIVTFPENRKFTLLYLALECGFNSKTSFNRNFKKVTNLSPSEYLNKQNIELT
ncbi:MAG: AraC family transcriptional regulator [Ignavibacteriaceae bacterium]